MYKSSYIIWLFYVQVPICLYISYLHVYVCGNQWSIVGVSISFERLSLGLQSGWSSQQAPGILPVPVQCCIPSVHHRAPCLPGCGESSGSHACVACAVPIVPSPLPWLPVYLVINFLRTVRETLARAAVASMCPRYLIAKQQTVSLLCVQTLH